MESTEKVSIILPVYNSEKFIERTLNSLINQTYKNIEILCINDGSSDNSLNILKEYSKKDSRIKVFTQENSGPARARNKGLENFTGEFLMFCDSDDCYETDMVEIMVKSLKENDVDFAMCDAKVIVQDKGASHTKRWRTIRYHTNMIDKERIIELGLSEKYKMKVFLWNKIFKANIIRKYKMSFPNGYENDDTCFIEQYMFAAKKYYAIKKQLYNYFIRNNSIMDIFYKRIVPNKLYDKIKTLEYSFKFLQKNRNLLTENNKKLYLCIVATRFKYSFMFDCQTEEEKQKAKDIMFEIVKKTSDEIKYPKIFYKLDKISVQHLNRYLERNSVESIALGYKYKIKEFIQKMRKTFFILRF